MPVKKDVPETSTAKPLSESLRKVYEQVTTYSEGSPADAAEEIRQLVALLEKSPDNLDIVEWLAFKYYSIGDYSRAERHYRELVAKGHRPAVQNFYLGNTLYKMERFREAIEAWEKVIALMPGDAKAQKARLRIEKLRRERGDLV